MELLLKFFDKNNDGVLCAVEFLKLRCMFDLSDSDFDRTFEQFSTGNKMTLDNFTKAFKHLETCAEVHRQEKLNVHFLNRVLINTKQQQTSKLNIAWRIVKLLLLTIKWFVPLMVAGVLIFFLYNGFAAFNFLWTSKSYNEACNVRWEMLQRLVCVDYK